MGTEHANTPTLQPHAYWKEMLPEYRKPVIEFKLDAYKHLVTVVEARESGYIILTLLQPLSAAERGTLLLDIEQYLKSHVDSGLTVWLDPQGDKSSLRNLRGIEIK